jgi:hypothetical protein
VGFSHALLQKLAEAVTPLGVSPPEVKEAKVVYIIGNTSCEPRPGAASCPQPSRKPKSLHERSSGAFHPFCHWMGVRGRRMM